MLGEYLKRYRLSRNLKQKEMASLLDMHQCEYSLLENGKLKLGIERINRVAKLLDVEPSFVRNLM